MGPGRGARWRRYLREQVPGGSMTAFRILLGGALALNVLRYAYRGWIEDLFIAPVVQFPYWGFGWLPRPDAVGVYGLFAGSAVGALLFASGRLYRTGLALFLFCFSYLELLDRSNYLNHYYLVTLIALMMMVMPLDHRSLRRGVPRWCIWALRLQLSIVYFYAGVAKLRPDWLFHGTPLTIWLPRHTDYPLLGYFFDQSWVALGMSWVGAFFDLTIPFWLWWKRTRAYAYGIVLAFHLVTASLFPIGIFPWVMMLSTTIFFAPDWPTRVRDWVKSRWRQEATRSSEKEALPRESQRSESTSSRYRERALVGAAVLFFGLQLLMPLRQNLYPGSSTWHGQGFRFAWNVMVMEKVGVADFRVVDAQGRETIVHPREELTPFQMRMMPTQPDLILAYAHHLQARWRHDGRGEVAVYVDSWVSLNGRHRARLVDPAVDLTMVQDGLAVAHWILPQPTDAGPPRPSATASWQGRGELVPQALVIAPTRAN